MKILLFFLFLGFLSFSAYQADAQINVLGKSGAILSPSAEWDTIQSLGFSFSYIPRRHAINNFIPNRLYTENIYSVAIPLTSFVRVNFNLTRLPEIPDQVGIGDRHVDISFRILKETDYVPSIALVISPNWRGSNYLTHDLIVASKTFSSEHLGKMVVSAGYGLPYFFGRPPDSNLLPDRLTFHRKSAIGNNYLNGFFGSVKWQPRDFVALMVEHDSQKWNMGLMLRWKEYLSVQGHLLNGRDPAFTLGTRIPLDSAPFEMRRAK